MASSSNSVPDDSALTEDLKFLLASHADVSKFVSVMLSGKENYLLWKEQMFCLMKVHDMCGLVDASFDCPKVSTVPLMKQYDNLLRRWILGSITQNVSHTISRDLRSAKDVWNKLKSFNDPTMSSQQDAHTKLEAKQETKGKGILTEIETVPETKDKDAEEGEHTGSTEESKTEEMIKRNEDLRKATISGNWGKAHNILENQKDRLLEAINIDGNTVVHLAVGLNTHEDFVKSLLEFITDKQVLEKKNSHGSTVLHIAAIVGNENAAKLLVEQHNKLLTIVDNKGEEPLFKAYSNMQFNTFIYLFKAVNGDSKTEQAVSHESADHIEIGINDISGDLIPAKQYDIAEKLVRLLPASTWENDEVLLAIARNFPSRLRLRERLIYPFEDSVEYISQENISFDEEVSSTRKKHFFQVSLSNIVTVVLYIVLNVIIPIWFMLLIFVAPYMAFIYFQCFRSSPNFLEHMVNGTLFLLYQFLWTMAKRLGVAPVIYIEEKVSNWQGATKVLFMVCKRMSEARPSRYNTAILEAACHDAYNVVDEILFRSPETIRSTDKDGYDIIQLAVIHRSERIYNLIYQIGERKSRSRTIKDSEGNNILHLAGKLAPLHELNRRSGAALQLQRDLQWREELKKIVFPTYINEVNKYGDTPNMVFTREHENLVKEGEKWMKATAESCSITAALITTIVFAAAITVPGGNNEEGIPVFTRDIAFTIFALSDAISLFTSTTSLLVFLSILTARFSEKDFLVSLPRRLIIGLCTLFLSTTAMIVAFGSSLFLVFCNKKPWMIAPICGLVCLPILFFVTLQFPLMVDLVGSTYFPIFGKKSSIHRGKFDPQGVQGFFGS